MGRFTAALAWSAGETLYTARNPHVPRTRRGRVVLALILVLLVGGGAGGYVWAKSNPLPENAAFAVGDHVVTEDALDTRVKTLHALYGVNPPQDRAKLDRFRRDVAKAVAVSIILQDKAKQMHIVIPDSTARDTLNKYVSEQLGPGPDGHDAFVKVLGNAGTNERAVLDEIRQQLAITKMYAEVTKDVHVNESDVEKSFPKYRDRLGVPEKRHLRNIVVTSQDRAQQILGKLNSGASFVDLARQYSIDGSTRNKGGDLGTVPQSQLQDAYATAAFSAGSGKTFGPVHNDYGWNIGQVVSVTPGQAAKLADVREQLRTLVDFDQRIARWGQWLSTAIKDADVRYAPLYQPANPDAAPTDAQADLAGTGGSGQAPKGPMSGPGK